MNLFSCVVGILKC